MNPETLFQELRVEFVKSGHHHCRPGWIQLKRCPYCGTSNYLLGYCVSGGFFVCWKCGGHRTYDTWQLLGMHPKDIKGVIKNVERPRVRLEKRNGTLKLPDHLGELLPAHKDYLRQRGFDPEEISSIWKIKGMGNRGNLKWRIFLPITLHGETVSWTTRTIGNSGMRYISAGADQEVINHKHLVYGMDFIRWSVVVVEGPLDAWRIGPGAGALFGTAYSTHQVLELSKIPNRFICFDNEPEAQRRARKLAETLSVYPGRTEVLELDAKDPGEATEKEIILVRKTTGIE